MDKFVQISATIGVFGFLLGFPMLLIPNAMYYAGGFVFIGLLGFSGIVIGIIWQR